MVRYLSLASGFVPRKLTDSDGTSVGAAETVGLPDGDPDGEAVGSELGAALTLGEGEGAGVGSSDGRPDGATETDGEAVGVSVGRYVGASVGDCPVFRVKVRCDMTLEKMRLGLRRPRPRRAIFSGLPPWATSSVSANPINNRTRVILSERLQQTGVGQSTGKEEKPSLSPLLRELTSVGLPVGPSVTTDASIRSTMKSRSCSSRSHASASGSVGPTADGSARDRPAEGAATSADDGAIPGRRRASTRPDASLAGAGILLSIDRTLSLFFSVDCPRAPLQSRFSYSRRLLES